MQCWSFCGLFSRGVLSVWLCFVGTVIYNRAPCMHRLSLARELSGRCWCLPAYFSLVTVLPLPQYQGGDMVLQQYINCNCDMRLMYTAPSLTVLSFGFIFRHTHTFSEIFSLYCTARNMKHGNLAWFLGKYRRRRHQTDVRRTTTGVFDGYFA